MVIIIDFLNSLVREITILGTIDASPKGRRDAGIVNSFIFTFLICVLAFCVIFGVFVIRRDPNEDCCSDTMNFKWCQLTPDGIGAVLYLYGDNLPYLMERHGEVLGCDKQCVGNCLASAIVFIGIAMILFRLPPFNNRFARIKDFNIKIKDSEWYSAMDLLVIFVQIDAVFTVVVSVGDTCSMVNTFVSIFFFVICFISLCVFIGFYGCYYCNADHQSLFVRISMVVLLLLFPLYMLGDNVQPLDCAFCAPTNQTFSNTTLTCNHFYINSGLRLSFIATSGVALSCIGVVLLFIDCRN